MLVQMLADRFDAGGVLRAKGTQPDVTDDQAFRWIGDGVALALGAERVIKQGTGATELAVSPTGSEPNSLSAGQLAAMKAQLPVNLVFDSPAAASANTAAINAIGNKVKIDGVGRLYFNDTLVAASIELGASVVLTAVPKTPGGTTFPAIRNRNLNAKRWPVGTITGVNVAGTPAGSAAGRFTVPLPGHTLGAGNWLYINGDTSEVWNGMYPIESAVPGVSVTILTGFANPKSGFTIPQVTGSLCLGCAADADFSVIGGTVDMNFLGGGFTAAGNYQDHGIVVNNALRPRVRTRVSNAAKYGLCMQNVVFPEYELDGQSYSDGGHIYGPCWKAKATGLTGSWGDDGMIFQCVDGAGYLSYMLPEDGRPYPGGHIYDGTISNTHVQWTGNSAQVALYPNNSISASAGSGGGYTWPAGDLGYRFKGCQVIDGVSHTLGASAGFYSSMNVSVGNGYCPNGGFIERLVIRNCLLGDIGLKNTGGGLITIGELVLDFCGTDTYTGFPLSINMDNIYVKTFSVRNGNFKNTNTNSPNVITFTSSTCRIDMLVYDHCIFGGGTGPGAYAFGASAAGGTLGCVHFKDCVGTDGFALIDLNNYTLAATPRIILGGDYTHRSALIAIGTAQAVDVYVEPGLKISSGTGQAALLNAYGTGKVRVFGGGVQFGGSAISYLNLSTGKACEWYVPDGSLPVDVGLLATTKGQSGYHSSSVGGRNAANQQGNFVNSNGTNFYALATGASGVNTLIV